MQNFAISKKTQQSFRKNTRSQFNFITKAQSPKQKSIYMMNKSQHFPTKRKFYQSKNKKKIRKFLSPQISPKGSFDQPKPKGLHISTSPTMEGPKKQFYRKHKSKTVKHLKRSNKTSEHYKDYINNYTTEGKSWHFDNKSFKKKLNKKRFKKRLSPIKS